MRRGVELEVDRCSPWRTAALLAQRALGLAALLAAACGPAPPPSPPPSSSRPEVSDRAALAPCDDPHHEDCFYEEGGRYCAGQRCTDAPGYVAPLPPEQPMPQASEPEGCRRGARTCALGGAMSCITDDDGCRLCTCDGAPIVRPRGRR